MGSIGPMELVLLGLLAVLIFGPAKLPEIGRSIGRATREFKDSISGTGIEDAIQGVGDVRSAMSPTNLARAAMPASVKQVATDVTDMKQTFTDPLGQKQATEQQDARAQDASADGADGAGETPAKAAPEPPAAPQA
jgi:TatA/E family protein of Tat protein translocase